MEQIEELINLEELTPPEPIKSPFEFDNDGDGEED